MMACTMVHASGALYNIICTCNNYITVLFYSISYLAALTVTFTVKQYTNDFSLYGLGFIIIII